MAKMLYQAVAFILFIPSMASVVEINTDLNANGAFSDLMTVRTSYFRSLCDANPLTWDQGLADIANQSVWNCDLNYDVRSLLKASQLILTYNTVLVPTRSNHLPHGR